MPSKRTQDELNAIIDHQIDILGPEIADPERFHLLAVAIAGGVNHVCSGNEAIAREVMKRFSDECMTHLGKILSIHHQHEGLS